MLHFCSRCSRLVEPGDLACHRGCPEPEPPPPTWWERLVMWAFARLFEPEPRPSWREYAALAAVVGVIGAVVFAAMRAGG
jgi:hypothetical protein